MVGLTVIKSNGTMPLLISDSDIETEMCHIKEIFLFCMEETSPTLCSEEVMPLIIEATKANLGVIEPPFQRVDSAILLLTFPQIPKSSVSFMSLTFLLCSK